MLEEIQKHQQVFSGIFGWSGGGLNNFEANGVRYAASLTAVTGDYFSTLGVQPLLGRLITPDDVGLKTGSVAPVAVLDYRCWQERYGGDPAVVGKTIRVDDRPLTIIGVTPKGFAGLILEGTEAIVPTGYSGRKTFRERKNLWLDGVGRLKPGITLEQARVHLTKIWPRIQDATAPEEYQGEQRKRFFARRISVEAAATGNSFMRERLSGPLALLMGLVGVVLLIACVNLANLMLARVAGRRHELGIRVALGASGWRLIQQLLAESILLSTVGAILGLVIAIWASRLLMNTLWTGYISMALDVTPDLRVLAFTAAIAVATGVLFGLAPASRVARTDPASALQHGTRTVRGGGGAFGKLLVCTQVAFSLVLVIGATLFVRSLEKLRSVDPGFDRTHVLLMQLFPQAGREKIPNRTQYYRQLAEKLSQLPGVESVSYSHMGPALQYEYTEPASIPSSSRAPVQAVEDFVGPGFFKLIGMRLLAGREFDWRDDERAPRVVVVSESAARRLFPGENPLGRKIDFGTTPDHKGMEIIGVVNSASLWKVQSKEPPAVYISLMQETAYNQSRINIRTAGDPWALAASARRTLESMGHHYPLLIETLEERADREILNQRLIAILSAAFGGLALLLSAVGLFGLMSYAVSRRTPEIGIRMALGAQQRDIRRLVLREVLWLVLAGIGAGIPAALAASRLVSGMLFGLPANDPATFALSAAILFSVAILAGYVPARRAASIDPMTALRSE
jgi:predicted permease